jgi:hypothetical protein
VTDELQEALTRLALRLKEEVAEGLSKGRLESQETKVLVWKVDKFETTDSGIVPSSSSGVYASKREWWQAIISVLIGSHRFPEYKLTSEQLSRTFGKTKADQAIEPFVTRIVQDLLNDPSLTEEQINETINTLIKGLHGDPLTYRATAGLVGIAINVERVEIDHGVSLRQPRNEDFEREVSPFSPPGMTPFAPYPTAILEVEILARGARELQLKIEHTIAMLRLFRVGSVSAPSYRLHSQSITDPFGSSGLSSSSTSMPIEKYFVPRQDTPKLRNFCRILAPIISPELYGFDVTEADHVTIAYRRYVDALMQNGLLERRIANSVMGLEALLLTGAEIQELVYRLSNRVGKLFAILGYDQYEVRQTIRDAYRVRNLFVHGSQLSYKEGKKLETKYKGVNNLLATVLNYVRVCLVVLIITKRGKEEFIDWLDDALIDRKRDEALGQVLQSTRDIVS